ncbi:hypothetical protein WA026_011264 [Henosepilachna vigintioctopunctata]|uniref:Uncharacterized protein n=1 Tax=Henosepilachna vigintioctopunctata TaxID=420089 RepID=A0AAW1TX30_9CUCU
MGSIKNIIHFDLPYLSEEINTISNQITENEDMLVTVFLNGKKLYADLSCILPIDFKLDRWSQIENLLIRYKKIPDSVDQSFAYLIEKCLCYLNEASIKISL